ncbi:MAG: sensor histidine kinase, partial [Phototrophicaceae bacterium]
LGLVPTVRRYADSYREKTDIIVKLDINGEERRLETHREVMIFRCVQELMGHARDYASASEVQVHLDMNGERIKIGVRDNGRGFDAEAVFSDEGHRDARAQGLVTLREKFELVGGTLSIKSGENEGTQVRVEIPSH